MIKIAAFIVPKKKILFKILNLKDKIKKIFGFQPYLLHPAHCTLFTMNVSNKILTKKKFFNHVKIKNSYSAVININKTGVFFNDPITEGNTIYFKIHKTSFLKILQLDLLNYQYHY